ncbi:hypothetical protein Goari_026034, partial [Gossypium aridum]|nr:hypothetical protein [Gossypium aridum]
MAKRIEYAKHIKPIETIKTRYYTDRFWGKESSHGRSISHEEISSQDQYSIIFYGKLLYTGEDRVICILRFISTCLFVESSPWGADYLFLTAVQNLLHLKQEFK